MHPKPDRSGYTPNFLKTAGDPSVDIGWNEGVLSDGRPYRVECWAEDGITMLTFFVPAQGLEAYGEAGLEALLVREGLVELERPGEGFRVMQLTDPSGNRLLSLNVVVGSGDDLYIGRSVPLLPYPRS